MTSTDHHMSLLQQKHEHNNDAQFEHLLNKYGAQVPRYTSFPSVPFWKGAPSSAQWLSSLTETLRQDSRLSVYVHLPFCESLCGFCGCHKIITKNHDSESVYVDALLAEWQVYISHWTEAHIQKQIDWSVLHLGGGTPTFFSPANLHRFLTQLFHFIKPQKDAFLSFEAHPESTSNEHLETLYRHGFKRLSLGVQDFSLDIQELIGRKQTTEKIFSVVNEARKIGYDSINFDLIYGLPKQKIDHIKKNIEIVQQLRPNRIALYSYAHVPWIKPSQRKFSEEDLPDSEEKIKLFITAKELLEKAGYVSLGLDHFSLPDDSLFAAKKTNSISRSFMGYCEHKITNSVGLGISSIGENPHYYVQNNKSLSAYLKHFIEDKKTSLFFESGHKINEIEFVIKEKIQQMMCHGRCQLPLKTDPLYQSTYNKLSPLIEDHLVKIAGDDCVATEQGQLFLRQAAAAFDPYFEYENNKNRFSKGI